MPNPLNELSHLVFWLGWERAVCASQWGDLSLTAVKNNFRRMALPWNDLVAQEAASILEGEGRRRFLFAFEWIHSYRKKRGIDATKREDRSKACAEGGSGESECSPTGTMTRSFTARNLRAGDVACKLEQEYFLLTSEWRTCAQAAYAAADYECTLCGANGSKLEIHHEQPLFTAYSPRFGNNFARWLLSVVCPTCHGGLHRDSAQMMDGSCRGLNGGITSRQIPTYPAASEYESEGQCTCRFCWEEIARRFPHDGHVSDDRSNGPFPSTHRNN